MTDLRSLVADARYEVIPLKNLEGQLEHIPTGASVSVTCSLVVPGWAARSSCAARVTLACSALLV